MCLDAMALCLGHKAGSLALYGTYVPLSLRVVPLRVVGLQTPYSLTATPYVQCTCYRCTRRRRGRGEEEEEGGGGRRGREEEEEEEGGGGSW